MSLGLEMLIRADIPRVWRYCVKMASMQRISLLICTCCSENTGLVVGPSFICVVFTFFLFTSLFITISSVLFCMCLAPCCGYGFKHVCVDFGLECWAMNGVFISIFVGERNHCDLKKSAEVEPQVRV